MALNVRHLVAAANGPWGTAPPEFSDFDDRYIEAHCIVGEVRANEVSVDQDVPDADTRMLGTNTEDVSETEGIVRYDIVFDAQVPDTQDIIRMIVNVEIQADVDPGYPLITRAIYYLCRLVSRQKGTVFTHSDYGKLRKVYSIWVCPDPRRENMNSIAEYGFTQQKVIGEVHEPIANYDKLKAIIISLNDEGMENRSDIIRLLSTLLSTRKSVEQRKQILEDEFDIPMTRDIEEEVAEMCNLGMAVELKGVAEGMERGMIQGMQEGMQKGMREGMQKGIREGMQKGMEEGMQKGLEKGQESARIEAISNIMQALKLTAQQAMDILKIPEAERERYVAKLS